MWLKKKEWIVRGKDSLFVLLFFIVPCYLWALESPSHIYLLFLILRAAFLFSPAIPPLLPSWFLAALCIQLLWICSSLGTSRQQLAVKLLFLFLWRVSCLHHMNHCLLISMSLAFPFFMGCLIKTHLQSFYFMNYSVNCCGN